MYKNLFIALDDTQRSYLTETYGRFFAMYGLKMVEYEGKVGLYSDFHGFSNLCTLTQENQNPIAAKLRATLEDVLYDNPQLSWI